MYSKIAQQFVFMIVNEIKLMIYLFAEPKKST